MIALAHPRPFRADRFFDTRNVVERVRDTARSPAAVADRGPHTCRSRA